MKQRGLILLGVGVLFWASAAAADNNSALSATVLVPDGGYVCDSNQAADQWFVSRLEAGKLYVIEVQDLAEDGALNSLSVTLRDQGDTAAFGATGGDMGICGGDAADTEPASLQAYAPGADGVRCLASVTSAHDRVLATKVTSSATPGTGNTFCVRVRDNTIYSRWSVNPYDQYVALQNTTGEATTADVILFDDTGVALLSVGYSQFGVAVPAYGANQIKRSSLTLSPNHGALRIYPHGTGLNVQVYAFNPVVSQYVEFSAEKGTGALP